MRFIVLLTILIFQLGMFIPNINAQNNSSANLAKEKLRNKLEQYVSENKVLEKNKVIDFNTATEFGEYRGDVGDVIIYQGSNYSLILSIEYIDSSHLKILDFLLDDKGKLCSANTSYSSCAILKNLKKDSRGFITGDNACEGISVVKLKTAETDCMIPIPIVKAWKKEKNGKFIEVTASGLTWYDECP